MALWNKTYKDSIFPTVLEMQLKLCQTWEFKRSQVYGILIARHVIQLSTQVLSMVKGLMRQFVLTFGLCCFGAGLCLCPWTGAGSHLGGPLGCGKPAQLGVATPAHLGDVSSAPPLPEGPLPAEGGPPVAPVAPVAPWASLWWGR